jgi:transposase
MPSKNTIPFDLSGFEVDRVDSYDDLLVIQAHSTASEAFCPDCNQSSSRVHSYYTREPRDLPSSGRKVRLVLSVRRFRCPNVGCKRQTFAERISQVTPVHGQRTIRLTLTLQAIALEMSAETGKRVTHALKMTVSGDTLLRILRRSIIDPLPTPRVLGVDDWAMKKGHRYGTILVDLEHHQVVDVLPDREADTLTTWLQVHPGIEIICRDRASDYAKAATAGAPQAIQIADRWHLLKNLGEALQRMLSSQTKVLRLAAKQVEGTSGAPTIMTLPSAEPDPLPALAEPVRSESVARRQLLFDEVKQLAVQGYSKRAIAQQLHIHRATVDHYLRVEQLPHRQPPRQVSKAAPCQAYVLKRIEEDGCSIHRVWQELQSQGFSGSYASVTRLVQRFRPGDARRFRRTQIAPPRPLSPRQAMWLLVRNPEQLTPDQVRYREILCGLSPDIAVAYDLAQRFVAIFKQHQVEELDNWLQDAQHATVPALRHFALSLCRDYAAVRASLTFDWSSGQVEGQVNRLKVIKRIMYGRANLDLLRLRVLQPP